jgi:diguanylate cyclase (GGDEF)-like protein
MAPVGEALLDAFGLTPADGGESIDFVVSQQSAIDGVALVELDQRGSSTLVYVSPGLAQLAGRSLPSLVGQPLANLIDGGGAPALGESSVLLRRSDGKLVAAHLTTIAAPAPHSPNLRLVLARDLSRTSVERLVADQAPVIDSLVRGQDLGSLCHQVASTIEAKLSTTDRCWIGVSDLHDRLEAVVTAGYDLELVGHVLRLTMSIGDPLTPRRVSIADLPTELAGPLVAAGSLALWAFPAIDPGGEQRGAIVVVTRSEAMPTDDEIRFLDGLAQVVAIGIERASLEATMAHRALHDPLTGLPNRALIVDRLEQAVSRLDREPASLSVLLVDIDRFKALNETWGPDVGDRVLIEVAGRLLGSLRLGDTVGRISSDQFLLICGGAVGFDPSVVARRVIESTNEPIRLPTGEEIHITASVGVVALSDTNRTPTAIIGNAESAVAKAVEGGRARFVLFDEGLQQAALARHDTEKALHTAIVSGELVLHYQPVCSVHNGQMVGAEALVRWQRPGHGLQGPAEFIDIAEDTGLIVPLGAWVIEEVARDLVKWPKAKSGRWPVVTVNLSARQLADESLVPMVDETLRAYGLAPARIGFEVTESMEVDDLESAIDTLDALSNRGCRIAIDDFGIGYATLDYLRRFSMANVLKVDRSFVAGLGRSREDTAIVKASLALAKALDMQVVAEGVEERSQLADLADLGCDFAQGFALSAPVPLESALQLWETGVLLR